MRAKKEPKNIIIAINMCYIVEWITMTLQAWTDENTLKVFHCKYSPLVVDFSGGIQLFAY